MTRSVSAPARRIGPILLVDDYDDARMVLREELENAGYSVLEASNGQQALDCLAGRSEQRIALIILDLQMPVMDGWRLLELLRCYVGLAEIPVIIVTAHEPRLEQLSHPRVYGCLRAPYTMQQLVDLVDACMAGARKPVWAGAAAKSERS